MGLLFVESLPGPKVFKCKHCRVDSASPAAIVSKEFRGRHGRAYLFDQVVNITCGDPEDRHMTTGMHTVRDICCERCGCTLGWKYVSGR